MCGIFCTLTCKKKASTQAHSITKECSEWEFCKEVVAARGPDSLGFINKDLTEQWHSEFHASVLWMQGPKPISQPLVDTDCNILLWNGDVFSGNLFEENICDSNTILSAMKDSTDIPSTLRQVKGPFSIIYYQKSSNQLYFARDKFGRHSLLFKIDRECDSLLLTSVAVKAIENIVEVPAIGIFIAELSEEKLKFRCIPWFEPSARFKNCLNDFRNQFDIEVNIVESNYLPAIERLTVIATKDKDMGFLKYVETASELETFDLIMEYLLSKDDFSQILNRVLALLNESVRRRVKIIPNFCRDCTKLSLKDCGSCPHVKVGILFSGGLDSAILAVIADKYIDKSETIDLINVAFQKKINSNYDVPDRKTGRQTYNELLKICPERKFNFIEVDVPRAELEKYRSTRISNLVYPHATVLDDSLACAVWFASRARGTIDNNKTLYESTCRVLLLGMGADEQFGGYMRHRTILKHKGWDVLTEELKLEFDRISERNLGRDDRMVADNGRQSRLPYLDEDLVDYVQKLAPWERCCPVEKFPPGLGDKLLLRLLAYKIKLHGAAKLPKRAFQFGSRIADGKENAKDLSTRL